MKFEFSAGGVVFRSIPSTGSGSNIEILVSQHSFHHGWVFPKGLIGDKEENKHQTKEETAVREVKEETGIDAEIVEAVAPVTYWYAFEGEKRKKTVYYFVMKHLGGNFEDRDTEMEAVEWVPIDRVMEKLTYPSDKKVWTEAREKIESLVISD
jgi:8-oxo-dGTP diphosphatase